MRGPPGNRACVLRAYRDLPDRGAIAARNDLIDAHAWLPETVVEAYSRAKQLRYDAMRTGWLLFGRELAETRRLMGRNCWSYGVEATAKALNALLQYAYEQGLANRRLTVEELFHPSALGFAES